MHTSRHAPILVLALLGAVARPSDVVFEPSLRESGSTSSAREAARLRSLPPAPRALRSEVYSETAAELFWERESVPGLRYEIARAADVIATTDGTSYFDDTLSAGRRYVYEVVAIDPLGERSSPSSLWLTTPGVDAGASPALAPPSELEARVYSRTAAELFWARPDTVGLVYDVARDGRVLARTDGTSHFDDTLPASGGVFLYEVAAVDREGRRSAWSSVTVSTPADPPPDPTDATLAPPSELEARVYSRTAAELFWARPTTLGLEYEIGRDGRPLARTDGTSYFDDTLSGGRRYAYEVVAIDARGVRSPPADIELTTPGTPIPPAENPFAEPDPEGGTAIARLGYPAAIARVDALVSGDYLRLYLDADEALAALLDRQRPNDGAAPFACPEGGSARAVLDVPLDEDERADTVHLDGCVVAGRRLTGRLTRVVEFLPFGDGSSLTTTLSFDEFVVDAGGEGTLTLEGSSERTTTTTANTACFEPRQSVSRTVENRIDTGRLVDADGATVIVGGNYVERDARRFRLNAGGVPGSGPCHERQELTFGGSVTVVNGDFGPTPTSIDKRGEIVRQVPDDGGGSADARLGATFADGSSVAVTATFDVAEAARVDIVSDGVAVSFAIDYRFEAR